jgi:tetratricopeptide (TPR) repeat protein
MLGGVGNKVTDGNGNVLAGGNVVINDLEQYEAHVERRIATHEAMLTKVHAAQIAASDAEKAALQQQITLLQQQIETDRARLRDADNAFAEYRDKIAQLELLLLQATGATADIGANRIADAKAALEAGDATKADAIFAEVEALEANAVRRAADAAFGRGLIAEEQVRWRDAADHYAKAARLNPSYDTLIKAGTFHARAGQHGAAIAADEALLALSRAEFGPDSPKTAIAMNNLAESYRAMGRYAEAEPLYRQAIDIGAKRWAKGIRIMPLA